MPLESRNEVQILAAIRELIGGLLSFDEVVATALRFTTTVMKADGSSILLIDRQGGDSALFYLPLAAGKQSLKSLTVGPGEGIAGFVAQSGLPLVVSDVSQERRFSKKVDQIDAKTRSLACAPLRMQGELKGAIEVFSDKVGNFDDKDLDMLTAVAGPLAILAGHARVLSEMKDLHDQLDKVSRLKSEFLATMTHELRTPVNIVISSLDLILGGYLGEVNDGQRSTLKTALRNAGEALNFVSSLLDLSRIDAGHPVIRPEDFRLEDLWAELEPSFRIGLSGKEVDLSWTVKASLPTLRTDKIKVKEIFSNVVFNAIKYTEKGKVEASVSPADGGRAVEIEVRDTGVGIPKEYLPTIFEPFHQVETPLTTRHGGVGLGLYIAKRLLNLLNGRIDVESEVGKGSTFRITIPTNYTG